MRVETTAHGDVWFYESIELHLLRYGYLLITVASAVQAFRTQHIAWYCPIVTLLAYWSLKTAAKLSQEAILSSMTSRCMTDEWIKGNLKADPSHVKRIMMDANSRDMKRFGIQLEEFYHRPVSFSQWLLFAVNRLFVLGNLLCTLWWSVFGLSTIYATSIWVSTRILSWLLNRVRLRSSVAKAVDRWTGRLLGELSDNMELKMALLREHQLTDEKLDNWLRDHLVHLLTVGVNPDFLTAVSLIGRRPDQSDTPRSVAFNEQES